MRVEKDAVVVPLPTQQSNFVVTSCRPLNHVQLPKLPGLTEYDVSQEQNNATIAPVASDDIETEITFKHDSENLITSEEGAGDAMDLPELPEVGEPTDTNDKFSMKFGVIAKDFY